MFINLTVSFLALYFDFIHVQYTTKHISILMELWFPALGLYLQTVEVTNKLRIRSVVKRTPSSAQQKDIWYHEINTSIHVSWKGTSYFRLLFFHKVNTFFCLVNIQTFDPKTCWIKKKWWKNYIIIGKKIMMAILFVLTRHV